MSTIIKYKKGITKIGDRSFEVSYSDADGVFTIINKEVPPENPEEPPTPEEPEHPENPEHPEHPQDKHVIPKTGVNEDLGAIYFDFVLLLGLVFIKKRYLVK